jgi:hypothetical protein
MIDILPVQLLKIAQYIVVKGRRAIDHYGTALKLASVKL